MLTKIEQGYVAQGFTLPDGMTWEQVAERRTTARVPDIYVPIGPGVGCWTWGVPLTDEGEFMMHTPTPDPRDPDPSRDGIFLYHNCYRCQNGSKTCAQGAPNRCDFPHARDC